MTAKNGIGPNEVCVFLLRQNHLAILLDLWQNWVR